MKPVTKQQIITALDLIIAAKETLAARREKLQSKLNTILGERKGNGWKYQRKEVAKWLKDYNKQWKFFENEQRIEDMCSKAMAHNKRHESNAGRRKQRISPNVKAVMELAMELGKNKAKARSLLLAARRAIK